MNLELGKIYQKDDLLDYIYAGIDINTAHGKLSVWKQKDFRSNGADNHLRYLLQPIGDAYRLHEVRDISVRKLWI
jgi:hypothetical protein